MEAAAQSQLRHLSSSIKHAFKRQLLVGTPLRIRSRDGATVPVQSATVTAALAPGAHITEKMVDTLCVRIGNTFRVLRGCITDNGSGACMTLVLVSCRASTALDPCVLGKGPSQTEAVLDAIKAHVTEPGSAHVYKGGDEVRVGPVNSVRMRVFQDVIGRGAGHVHSVSVSYQPVTGLFATAIVRQDVFAGCSLPVVSRAPYWVAGVEGPMRDEQEAATASKDEDTVGSKRRRTE